MPLSSIINLFQDRRASVSRDVARPFAIVIQDGNVGPSLKRKMQELDPLPSSPPISSISSSPPAIIMPPQEPNVSNVSETAERPYVFRKIPQEIFERILMFTVEDANWHEGYPILQGLSSVSKHWRHMIYGIPKFSATLVLHRKVPESILHRIVEQHQSDPLFTILCTDRSLSCDPGILSVRHQFISRLISSDCLGHLILHGRAIPEKAQIPMLSALHGSRLQALDLRHFRRSKEDWADLMVTPGIHLSQLRVLRLTDVDGRMLVFTCPKLKELHLHGVGVKKHNIGGDFMAKLCPDVVVYLRLDGADTGHYADRGDRVMIPYAKHLTVDEMDRSGFTSCVTKFSHSRHIELHTLRLLLHHPIYYTTTPQQLMQAGIKVSDLDIVVHITDDSDQIPSDDSIKLAVTRRGKGDYDGADIRGVRGLKRLTIHPSASSSQVLDVEDFISICLVRRYSSSLHYYCAQLKSIVLERCHISPQTLAQFSWERSPQPEGYLEPGFRKTCTITTRECNVPDLVDASWVQLREAFDEAGIDVEQPSMV